LGTAPRLLANYTPNRGELFQGGGIKRRVAVKGEQSLPPPRKEGELVPS